MNSKRTRGAEEKSTESVVVRSRRMGEVIYEMLGPWRRKRQGDLVFELRLLFLDKRWFDNWSSDSFVLVAI
jgi:hypothetical protein